MSSPLPASFYGTGGPGTIVGTLDTMDPAPLPATATDRERTIATIQRLSRAIEARNATIGRFDAYYRGEQGRRFIGSKYRELFARLFESYAENFCGVVVDAVEERLDIEGFRFPRPAGGEGTSDVAATDDDAWRIWQDNQLDARSQIAHTEALVKSVVYVLVSPFRSERVSDRSPRITVEDPCQTIVEFRPGSTERTIGMKRWSDGDLVYATLYYPDRIEKWQARRRRWANQHGSGVTGEEIWEERRDPGDSAWPLPHELGVVPLVPLINRPRLDGSGQSEIEQVIPIQDAINTIAVNELVASESSAFPQKWATGIEIPKGDDGKDVEPWKPDIDRILSTKVPDAKFGQFEAADLARYGDSIDRRVKRIASITRTPYHYFLDHGGQPPSGDSLRSSETGLVRKARRRQRQFGEGWEEVMRLAFRALGDARADVSDAATAWADPESLTESEHVDALSKARSALKVPLEILWEEAGYSPQQRAQFWALLEAERGRLDSTPVATTQPAAFPAPGTPPADAGGPTDAGAAGSQPGGK